MGSGGVRRRRGSGTVSTPGHGPPSLRRPQEGLPGRNGQLPSTVLASCSPGCLLTASQEGPGVRRAATNCLSPHRPTVSQESKVPRWELRTACQGTGSCHSKTSGGQSGRPPMGIRMTAVFLPTSFHSSPSQDTPLDLGEPPSLTLSSCVSVDSLPSQPSKIDHTARDCPVKHSLATVICSHL